MYHLLPLKCWNKAIAMTIDADIQQVLEALADQPLANAARGSLEELRESKEKVELAYDLPKTPMHQERSLEIQGPNGSVPIQVYWPRILLEQEPVPALLFMHGGGWVFCNMNTHANMLRYLCQKAGAIGINLGYRLAPEHKFPIGIEDCYAALEWICANAATLGADANRIHVAGDSAGGNLAAVICLLSRERSGPKIAAQLLFYPSLAIGVLPRYPSWASLPKSDKQAHEREINALLGYYLNSPDQALDFRVSPILAEHHRDLPKALIITAEYDPFRDDGLRYAEKLQSSCVPVDYRCFQGAVHAFMSLAGGMKRGYVALDYAADFICRHNASSTPPET